MKYKDLFKTQTCLEIDAEGNPTEKSLKVAIVSILWEMAYADGVLAEEELEQILRSVCREFHLMDDEALHLTELADFFKRHNEKFNEFLDQVAAQFTVEQRWYLMTLVAHVAKADGQIHKRETELADKLRVRLKL